MESGCGLVFVFVLAASVRELADREVVSVEDDTRAVETGRSVVDCYGARRSKRYAREGGERKAQEESHLVNQVK